MQAALFGPSHCEEAELRAAQRAACLPARPPLCRAVPGPGSTLLPCAAHLLAQAPSDSAATAQQQRAPGTGPGSRTTLPPAALAASAVLYTSCSAGQWWRGSRATSLCPVIGKHVWQMDGQAVPLSSPIGILCHLGHKQLVGEHRGMPRHRPQPTEWWQCTAPAAAAPVSQCQRSQPHTNRHPPAC